MKPRKVIDQRKQSSPALCQRVMAESRQGWFTWRTICQAPMELCITTNPIRALPFDELITLRCIAGHIERGDGVAFCPLSELGDDIRTEGV